MSELLGILPDNKASMQYTSMENLFTSLEICDIQQQVLEKFNITIQEFGISWILKLVDRLDNEVNKNMFLEYNYYSGLIDIQYKLLVFILEDSNYLEQFPNQPYRSNLEERLRKVSWIKEGLNLIQTNQDIVYILDIARKLITSGYIFDREHRLSVLETLYFYSYNLLTLSIDVYIRLLNIFENVIPLSLTHSVSIRFAKEKNELDDLLHYHSKDNSIQQKGENTLRLLAAYILLDKSNLDTLEQVSRRITFYRYLYILSNYKHDILREKTFEVFTHLTVSNRNEYHWQDIIDFSLPAFIKKIISSLSVTQQTDSKKRVFNGNGKIILHNTVIKCYPNYTSKIALQKTIHYFNGQVVVTSTQNSPDLNNIESLVSLWRSIIDQYTNKPQERNIQGKERPDIDTIVKIQVKNLHPINPLFGFVRVLDDRYKGDGVLHVKEITRVKLQTLEGILNPGDIMSAKVIESTPERLSFSIINELDLFIGARFHKDETTQAQLLNKRKDLLTWLSEDGYTLYSGPSSNFDPEIGSCYLLKIKDVNYNGYIKAKIIEQVSDIEIEPHEAVSNLVYHYKDIPAGCEDIEDDGEPEYILPDKIITEFDHILDMYTNSSRDILQKMNYLFLNKLINIILNNPKATEYYSILINYYLSLYKFAKGEYGSKESITEEIIANYPALREKKNTLLILSYDNEQYNPELLEITLSTSSPDNIRLAKLMLLYNLSKAVKPELASLVKNDIFPLLSFKPEDKEQENDLQPATTVNFGVENNYREFKTSIVFSNKNSVANLDNQLEVILRTICGFLNAQGGTLYIGVSDDGPPTSIEEDLQFMRCNEDTYQLKIRQFVVEKLGKDINSLLTLSFRKYSNKTVCAIAVPSYHTVVKLHNTVFQRQGNATRPLENKNVKLLMQRKKGNGLTNKAPYPLFPEDPNYFSTPKTTEEINSVNKIATSIFHEQTFNLNGYFSILENNKYVITKTTPEQTNVRLSLPIPDALTRSYLLFVYDNGYANRISATLLSNKKLGYEYQNALNLDASILFVAFVQVEDFLLINSELKKEDYSKIIPINKIKIGTKLSLKGSQVLSGFDNIILVDVLSPEHVLNLHVDENKSSIGFPATSLEYLQDTLYLKKLLESRSKQ